MIGINQTYGREETRNLREIWLYSFLFTILFTLAILLIAVAYIFSADVGAVIFEKIGLYTYYYPVLSFFAVAFSWIVSTFIFNMIYVMAPAQPLKIKNGLPGAYLPRWDLISLFVFLPYLLIIQPNTVRSMAVWADFLP